jgi:hypothetical protein
VGLSLSFLYDVSGRAVSILLGTTVSDVGFLGFVNNAEEVTIESDQISTIEDWLTPKSAPDE